MQVHTLNTCLSKHSAAYGVLRETGDKFWTPSSTGSKQEPRCGVGQELPGCLELTAEGRTLCHPSAAVVWVSWLLKRCCWGAQPPSITWQSWEAAHPSVQLRVLSKWQEPRWGEAHCAQQWGFSWGWVPAQQTVPVQQKLRDWADEKEKGKQGGLTTKQTGNLKQPFFHKHITMKVFSWS